MNWLLNFAGFSENGTSADNAWGHRGKMEFKKNSICIRLSYKEWQTVKEWNEKGDLVTVFLGARPKVYLINETRTRPQKTTASLP
jgi:hypothetical protein